MFFKRNKNCFPKEYVRNSMFVDKFVKNFDFGVYFGNLMIKKDR